MVLALVAPLVVAPVALSVVAIYRRPLRAVKFVEQGRHKSSPGDTTAKMLDFLLSSRQKPNSVITKAHEDRIEAAIKTLEANPRWGQWSDLAEKRRQREGTITNFINGLSNI